MNRYPKSSHAWKEIHLPRPIIFAIYVEFPLIAIRYAIYKRGFFLDGTSPWRIKPSELLKNWDSGENDHKNQSINHKPFFFRPGLPFLYLWATHFERPGPSVYGPVDVDGDLVCPDVLWSSYEVLNPQSVDVFFSHEKNTLFFFWGGGGNRISKAGSLPPKTQWRGKFILVYYCIGNFWLPQNVSL